MPFPAQAEFFSAPILRKIELARQLAVIHGSWFLADPGIRGQFTLLTSRLDQLQKCMAELEFGRICTACGQGNDTGGCCSPFMAGENDTIQLLINLLAGNSIEPQHHAGQECLFLGAGGCVLGYKPFFCLNYLCERIKQATSEVDQRKLAAVTGALLQAQYDMEQRLMDLIKKQGTPSTLNIAAAQAS